MARNKAAGLLEIGVEGFATLEDHYRNPRKPPQQERQTQYGNYRFQQQPYMNRRNHNYIYSVPPKKEDVIDCNEAAKLYGGVLFKEAVRKKKSIFSFGFSKAK